MSTAETLKLPDALFKSSFKAFKVMQQPMDEEDYHEWDLEPLMGPTLARQYVQGPFEGIFIIAAKVITQTGPIQDCYLRHRFARAHLRTLLFAGRRWDYEKQRSPGRSGKSSSNDRHRAIRCSSVVLCQGESSVRHRGAAKGIGLSPRKRNVAYDLAVLLRDEKEIRGSD